MRMRSNYLVCFALLLLFCHWTYAALFGPGQYPMGGKYVGVLPCAHCAGVWTEVTLIDPGPNLGSGFGTFVMTERFTGGVHGGATVTTRGLWSTVKRDDNYTGTLELRGERLDGNEAAPRYFYCDHGNSLRMLDSARHELSDKKSAILQRDVPSLSVMQPVPGPVTKAESGTTQADGLVDALAKSAVPESCKKAVDTMLEASRSQTYPATNDVSREEITDLWLKLLVSLNTVSETYKVKRLPVSRIVPPVDPEGTTYPIGTEPSKIKDPQSRADYISALKRNEELNQAVLRYHAISNCDVNATAYFKMWLQWQYGVNNHTRESVSTKIARSALPARKIADIQSAFIINK